MNLPPPAPPPTRPRRRSPLVIGVVVGVVIVVLLLVFLLPPLLSPSSSPGSGGALTYSQARPVADRAMSGYAGGGWSAIFAAGLQSPVPVSTSLNLTGIGGANCTFTPASSGPTALTLPAFTGNHTQGAAPTWEFGYENTARNVTTLVTVENGGATILGSFSSGFCATFFALITPVPSSVIDSSQAAAAVATQAQPFLSQYPNASGLLGLTGGISFGILSLPPEWTVQYSTCPLNTSSVGLSGTTFNATVNALTGKVLYSQTASAACGSTTTGSTPLGSALTFGPESTAQNATAWTYNYTVTSASAGLTFSDLAVSVLSSGGVLATAGWNLTVLNVIGTAVVSYSPTVGAWSGTPSASIQAVDVFSLVSSTNYAGYVLTLTGTSTYSGAISLTL